MAILPFPRSNFVAYLIIVLKIVGIFSTLKMLYFSGLESLNRLYIKCLTTEFGTVTADDETKTEYAKRLEVYGAKKLWEE
jgi:hypothetical protein